MKHLLSRTHGLEGSGRNTEILKDEEAMHGRTPSLAPRLPIRLSEFGVDALKVRGYLAFNSLIRT